jgi:putative ABC transport system permease protein
MQITRFYSVVARLKSDADVQMARVELDGILQRRNPSRVADRTERAVVMTLHERRHGDSRKPALLLFAAVAVLLLIACANLANLALARAVKRQREFGMRIALGASRWRLMRFVFAENLLLAAGGGLLGVMLASASVGSFVRISPGSLSAVEGVQVNGAVIVFTFGVALLTGVLFGIVPALTAGRGSLSDVLSSGSQRTSAGRRQRTLRRTLVVVELATAVVFLTGAGLVGKTLYRVTRLDAGFEPRRLLSADVSLPATRYPAGPPANAVFAQLLDAVRRLPAVRSAAWTGVAPFGGVMMSVQLDSVGSPSRRFDVVGAGPGYLETLGARLISGRTFTPDDKPGAPAVAVVTETYARTFHPAGDAIGSASPVRDVPRTIVGIVSDVRQRDLENQPQPLVFLPIAQSGDERALTLMVRTAGDPELVQPMISAALRGIDASIPAPTFSTMERVVATETAPRRFTFALVALFAFLAALIAIVGLYGLLSYLVSEQTREIGIRVALGADARSVMRRVVGQGMLLVGLGTVVGVVGALGSVRILKAFVFNVSVYDVETFLVMTAGMMATAFVAAWIPARRASRVDPMIALRAD